MAKGAYRTILLASLIAFTACTPFDAEEASFAEGSRFPELALDGYIDSNRDGKLTPAEHGSLRSSDVVNAYPNAELLLVHVAFEWCKYCWEETTEQIAWTKHYGGRFIALQVMVETRDGHAGERMLLDRWVRAHESMLPTVIEPEQTLLARFGRNATYILVDPKADMTILAVGAGPPQFEIVRRKIHERLGALPAHTVQESQ